MNLLHSDLQGVQIDSGWGISLSYSKKGGSVEVSEISERRQYTRYIHKEPVQFQFKDPRSYGGCLSYDLGQGGIRIHLTDFVPLNTEIILRIKLDEENVVDCSGYVTWVEKIRFGDYYQAGLKFVGDDAAAEVQKMINQFLDAHRQ